MHITAHGIALELINHAAKDPFVASELVRYIDIAKDTAIAMKAEQKLMNDLGEKGLKHLTKGFDMDREAAGTEYALKMALRSFRSDTII